MKLSLVLAVLIAMLGTAAQAQSLKREAPSPLQAGVNKGTVDNFVGPQYWYCNAGPGAATWHVIFKSMGLLGASSNCTLTVSIQDPKDTWITTKTVSSYDKPGEITFNGNLKKPIRVLMTVAPPSGGLVRMGGDYEIQASGAVAFSEKSNVDPVIGMYKQMSGYTQLLGDCKFGADGSIVTTNGMNGTWKLFDADSHTYVIDIGGQERHSCQFVEGRGLMDNGSIVFQSMK